MTRHGAALPWPRQHRAAAPPARPARGFLRCAVAKPPRRAMARQREAGPQRGGDVLEAFAGARRAVTRSTPPSLAQLAPLFRRSPRSANAAPAKAMPRRPAAPIHAAAPRGEDWRAKAIRAAWATWDWHTLKAFGQVDQVPEP